MEIFKKNLVFNIDSENFSEKQIINFFVDYNFNFKKVGDNEYLFFKKASWFEGWKINPLNWESEIKVSKTNSEISISYKVNGLYITPIAFESLYSTFLESFRNYIVSNESYALEIKSAVTKAKRSLSTYYFILIVGIAIAFFIAKIFNRIFDSYLFGILVLIAFAKLFEKTLNYYLENRVYK